MLVQHRTLLWLESQGILLNPPAFDDISEVGLLASHTYPDAPADKLQLAADWSTLFFLLDDFVETEDCEAKILERNADVVSSLRNEPGSPNRTPIYTALRDVGSRAADLGGVNWMERFTEQVRLWLDSHLWERGNRKAQRVPPLAEYVAMRQFTIGMYFEFLLSELTDGYHLTEAERESPEVVALARLANTQIAWTNDILTLEKELRQKDVHNLVLCLMCDGGLGVRDALLRATEMHNQKVGAFLDLAQRVLGPGASESLHAYVRALQHWMGGHMLWAGKSRRYQGGRRVASPAQVEGVLGVPPATHSE